MFKESMSRRRLLKLLGAGAAGAVLAACQPKVVKETVVVEKEVEKEGPAEAAPEGPTEVNVMAAGWVDTQWAISQRTNEYNASQDEVRVNVSPVPEGWDTKVLTQIQKDELQWDGYLTHHPFRVSVMWLAQGLIQPIDAYLDTNSVLDMSEFWADAIAPEKVKYDCSIKEEVIGVPLGIDTTCTSFRMDLMEQAGLPHTREDFMEERESWDVIQSWAETLREEFKGDGVWGIMTWAVYHQSLGAIFQSITSDLYDDDGLIKFDSEAMQRALEIQAKWSWTGVAPTPSFGAEPWRNGKAGLWQGPVGHVGMAQQAWGRNTIAYACPILVEEGGTGGNQWYTTDGFCFNKAQHPQELIDYYLWMFGPQNDQNAVQCLEYNWFPVFQSQWEKQIDPNPEYQWTKDFLPQFENAKLIPRNPYYEIQQSTATEYCELAQAQKIGIEEACNKMMEDIREKLADLEIEW